MIESQAQNDRVQQRESTALIPRSRGCQGVKVSDLPCCGRAPYLGMEMQRRKVLAMISLNSKLLTSYIGYERQHEVFSTKNPFYCRHIRR